MCFLFAGSAASITRAWQGSSGPACNSSPSGKLFPRSGRRLAQADSSFSDASGRGVGLAMLPFGVGIPSYSSLGVSRSICRVPRLLSGCPLRVHSGSHRTGPPLVSLRNLAGGGPFWQQGLESPVSLAISAAAPGGGQPNQLPAGATSCKVVPGYATMCANTRPFPSSWRHVVQPGRCLQQRLFFCAGAACWPKSGDPSVRPCAVPCGATGRVPCSGPC